MKEITFDWQGHRGARGLAPENTIPSFLKALEYPVTTLELDVAVSKDGQIILSHEPWMSEHICSKPDGTDVTAEEALNLKIMELTYEEIKQFDCGSRGNSRFAEQQAMSVNKPSLKDVVEEVKIFCAKSGRPLPYFNIEIKSKPEGDLVYTPSVEVFTRLLLMEIEELGIKEKTCIQSFDERPLNVIRQMDASIVLAFLVENENSFSKNLKKLEFLPEIYSPNYKLIKKRHVKKLHKLGIKVIPWTVNTVEEMNKLIRMGVDGIITDYPNLISLTLNKK